MTGGGTGGHVYPAVAIADELVRRGHSRDEIHFVGAARGLEARVVPDAGYSRSTCCRARAAAQPGAAGAARQRRGALGDVSAPSVARGRCSRSAGRRSWSVSAATRRSRACSRRGCAACPSSSTSRTRRRASPTVSAVRLGARAAMSLPGTPLRGAMLTGNPIRAEIAAVRPAPGGDRSLVGVFGGSLGARHVNDAVLDLAARWRSRDDLRGPSRLRVSATTSGVPVCSRACARPATRSSTSSCRTRSTWRTLYAHATLAVCRAGAVTVAELTVAGVPAVLVPLPGAPSDHQTRNARHAGGRGRGRGDPRRRAATAPGSRRRWTGCSPSPTGSRRCATRARSLARAGRGGAGRRSRRGGAPRAALTPGRRSSTWVSPRRVHIVGIGGVGHERHRDGPGADGPPGERLRPEGVVDAHATRAVGVTTSVGHAADERADRCRRGRRARPRSRRPTPRSWRRASAASPVLRRAEALAALVATRRTIAVAGSARQDDHVVDARA